MKEYLMHIDRFYMLIKTKPILVFQVLTKFSSLNFSFLVNKEAKHYFTMSVIFILKSRNFEQLHCYRKNYCPLILIFSNLLEHLWFNSLFQKIVSQIKSTVQRQKEDVGMQLHDLVPENLQNLLHWLRKNCQERAQLPIQMIQDKI